MRALGFVLGWFLRAWIATWRVSVLEHPALREPAGQGARILAFFHGTQLAFHVVRRARPTAETPRS